MFVAVAVTLLVFGVMPLIGVVRGFRTIAPMAERHHFLTIAGAAALFTWCVAAAFWLMANSFWCD